MPPNEPATNEPATNEPATNEPAPSAPATHREAEIIPLSHARRSVPLDPIERIDDEELELLVASGLAMRDVAWQLGTSLERIYQRLLGLRVTLDERSREG